MTNLINKYKGEGKMQNLQNELQMLGIDNFQVGNLITIDPNLNDPRHFGGMRCGGGMMCGGMRCGGFRLWRIPMFRLLRLWRLWWLL
jgi:hypothetical protein